MLGYFLLERNETKEAERALTQGIDLLQWTGEYGDFALHLIAQMSETGISSSYGTDKGTQRQKIPGVAIR